jgi:NADPH:quinone reductase-like Zn-dependent oxidoreductase
VKTTAAILWGLNQTWEIDEVELDGPKHGEVTVKMIASGLCHSDHHLVTGDIPHPFPVVGRHEGAGIVVEVGRDTGEVDVGDRVVLSFPAAAPKPLPRVARPLVRASFRRNTAGSNTTGYQQTPPCSSDESRRPRPTRRRSRGANESKCLLRCG